MSVLDVARLTDEEKQYVEGALRLTKLSARKFVRLAVLTQTQAVYQELLWRRTQAQSAAADAEKTDAEPSTPAAGEQP